jgi:hypothetical protein
MLDNRVLEKNGCFTRRVKGRARPPGAPNAVLLARIPGAPGGRALPTTEKLRDFVSWESLLPLVEILLEITALLIIAPAKMCCH